VADLTTTRFVVCCFGKGVNLNGFYCVSFYSQLLNLLTKFTYILFLFVFSGTACAALHATMNSSSPKTASSM